MAYFPTNLKIFDVILLSYYINLRSSLILCPSSGDIYLSLGISSSCSFVAASEWFCCDFLKIKSTILLPNKSPIVSAAFWIARFEAVLSASMAN